MRRPPTRRLRPLGVAAGLGVLALAQVAALWWLSVPAYDAHGSAHPGFSDGVAEARRLLHVTEGAAPAVAWKEQAPRASRDCKAGHFAGPDFVATQIGDSYWVTATASGDESRLETSRAAIEARWRKWYRSSIGHLVEDPTLTDATASSPRGEARYSLTLQLRDGTLSVSIRVAGCFGPNLRQLWN